jgi:cell division septal protein FtsQ
VIRAARVGCIVCSFLIALCAALRWGGWWRVGEVWVSSSRYVAAEQLTGILLGANVLRLQTRGIADWIQRDPRVLDVTIRVRPLGKRVEVEIKEREPAVQVQLQGGATVWVDAEGVILEPGTTPVVVGASRDGARVSPEAVQAAWAVARLDPTVRERFPTFDISDPTNVIAKGDRSPTLFLGEIGQLGDRLAILEELWKRGLLAECATVDFRVSDEVILKRTR